MLWIRIYFNFFLNLLVWVSAMQCNVECKLPEEDVILKDPPPPQRGHAYGGMGGSPPSYAPEINHPLLGTFMKYIQCIYYITGSLCVCSCFARSEELENFFVHPKSWLTENLQANGFSPVWLLNKWLIKFLNGSLQNSP